MPCSMRKLGIHVGCYEDVGFGKLKKTTGKHASMIKQAHEMYENGELSEQDAASLETYIRKSFEQYPDKTLVDLDSMNPGTSKDLRLLQIMVATDCNLKCKYCYADNGSYGGERRIMTPEEALSYVEPFIERHSNIGTVFFFGGEPTLAPETIEAVCCFFEAAHEEGRLETRPVFTMVTNATLIDENLAAVLAKHKVRVTVSIDGPPEINDRVRQTKMDEATFSLIAEGIKNLADAGNPPVMLEGTYTALHERLGYSRNDITDYLRQAFKVEIAQLDS